MTILEEAGMDAEFGGLYWEWDGSGLDDVSPFFFLTGYEYNETVADSVQEALVDFVSAGGGIMTTEWMLYETGGGYYDMITAMAPSLYDDDYDYYTETYTVAVPAHPIAQGLPASFATPDDAWSYSLTVADPTPSKQATVVITGSASGDAVVAGKYGLGRTVHWNMAGQNEGEEIWSTEVRQILVNIAKYISGAAS